MVEQRIIDEGKTMVETLNIDTLEDYYKMKGSCKEIYDKISIDKVQKETTKMYININMGRDDE